MDSARAVSNLICGVHGQDFKVQSWRGEYLVRELEDHGEERIWLGILGVSSLLYGDDVDLLATSSNDLQLTLGSLQLIMK